MTEERTERPEPELSAEQERRMWRVVEKVFSPPVEWPESERAEEGSD